METTPNRDSIEKEVVGTTETSLDPVAPLSTRGRVGKVIYNLMFSLVGIVPVGFVVWACIQGGWTWIIISILAFFPFVLFFFALSEAIRKVLDGWR